MNILVNALILSNKITGYSTVLKEYLLSIEKILSINNLDIKIFLIIQKKAIENIDPQNTIRNNKKFSIILAPNFKYNCLRVIYEQIFVNYYAWLYNCDIIHSPASVGIAFPIKPQIMVFYDAVPFSLPLKMHGRSWLATKILCYIIKYSTLNSKLVAVATNFSGDKLNEFLRKKINYFTVYSGVQNLNQSINAKNIRPDIMKMNGENFLLYVSSFYELKNQKILISLAQKNQKYNIVLAGNPMQKEYFNQCLEMQKEFKNIYIFESLNFDELKFLYNHCNIYICPSYFEGFALTPLEALQFNKPILLADIPVLKEVYGEGFLYFDPNSVDDLSNKINFIDKNYISFCTNNSLLKKYTWINFALSNLLLYKKIF